MQVGVKVAPCLKRIRNYNSYRGWVLREVPDSRYVIRRAHKADQLSSLEAVLMRFKS